MLEQTLLLTILVLRLYSIPLISLFRAVSRSRRPTHSTRSLSGTWPSCRSGTSLHLRLHSRVSELCNIAWTKACRIYRTINILYKLGDFLQDEGPSEILGNLGQSDDDPLRLEPLHFVSPTHRLGAHTGPTASQVYHAALRNNDKMENTLSTLGGKDSSSDESGLVQTNHDKPIVDDHIVLPVSRRDSDTSIQATPERFRSPFNHIFSSPESNKMKHSPAGSPLPTSSETSQLDVNPPQRRTSQDRMEDQRAPLPKLMTSSPEFPTWTKVFDVCEHPNAPDSLRRCQTCVRRQTIARSRLPRRSLDVKPECRTSNNDTQLSLPVNPKSSPSKLRRRSRKEIT